MADPVNFQVLGAKVQQMAADGVEPGAINQWLGQAGTSLDMLNASGFGLASAKAKSPDSVPSTMRSAGIGLTQGLTAGFGDEAASAIAATVGRPGGEALPGATWGDRYQAGLDIARPQQKEAQEAHPYAYGGAELAGAVVPALVAPEAMGTNFITRAPTAMSMAGRSGAIGAVQGGVNALGRAEGTAGQQALQTALGGATGALVGAVAPYAINKASDAVRWVWNKTAGWRPATTVAEAETVAPSFGSPAATTTTPLPTPVGDSVERMRPRARVDVSQSNQVQAVNKIAEALRRDGYTTEQIAPILNQMGPQGTLADVGENTKQLLVSTMTAPGAAKQIGKTALDNRQLGQQASLERSTQRALGTEGNIHESDAALLARREADSGPAYDAFHASSPDIYDTPFMRRLIESPTGQQLMTGARRIYELERIQGRAPEGVFTPTLDAEGNPSTQLIPQSRVLDYVKQAIDHEVEQFVNPMTGRVQGPMGHAWDQLRRTFLTDIDQHEPQLYAAARRAYSGPTVSRRALELGRQFMREDAEASAGRIADMAPEDAELFRQGALRALVDKIKGSPADVSVVQQLRKTNLLDKVRAIVPNDTDFQAFIQDLNNQRRFALTRAEATGGSKTAEKLLGALDLAGGVTQMGQQAATGNTGGLIMSALNKAKNMLGPGENTRAMIAQRLLQTAGPERDQLMQALAYAQRLQSAVNRGGAIAGVSGAATGGPAGASLGRQP